MTNQRKLRILPGILRYAQPPHNMMPFDLFGSTVRGHPAGCACPTCVGTIGQQAPQQHLTWRERKRQRRQPPQTNSRPWHAPCSCGCSTCSGIQREQVQGETHQFWRDRRSARLGQDEQSLELLLETPVLHLVGRTGQPLSALPGVYREFDPETNTASEFEIPGIVRIVYVYQHNPTGRCLRPRTWQRSERDVLALYGQKAGANPQGQATFYRNRLLPPGSQTPKGSTKPDVLLASGNASLSGLRLPLPSRQELELVEVKRYRTDNIPTLFSRLIRQVKARARVNIPNGPTGKYQSVVLDFRGQEADCAKIKEAARNVAQRLKTQTRGITILVQVLLWRGPNCRPCQGQTQTF